MKRRNFLRVAAAGSLGSLAIGPTDSQALPQQVSESATDAPPSPMVLGTQNRPPDGNYEYFTRFGVNHICGYPRSDTIDGLRRLKADCEAAGVSLDMIPAFGARTIGLVDDEAERERAIDRVIEQIQFAAEVGIPAIKYNITILNVVRTESTPGRGGTRYSTWRYEDAPDKNQPITFPEERFWERVEHVVERIIPVATEHKIRMACHPHDPGMPPQGYRGVQRILGTVDGLKRFVALSDSPYHGLNLCVGTTGEMLQDPAAEICDVVRYFGERKKIFNIHFRNIKGKRDDFMETYPDNGSMRMIDIMRTLREVQYPYMVMPDHVPNHSTDSGGRQAFAFAFGYIRALLQAINDEPNGPA